MPDIFPIPLLHFCQFSLLSTKKIKICKKILDKNYWLCDIEFTT